MQVKIVISVYFIVVLAVGVYSYFRIKTPADFYISGKKAGLISVTGSMLATILGGSAILGTIELSKARGWPAIWFLCSAAIGLFLLLPLIKNINKTGHFTMPELLETFYGQKAKQIASVIIPVAWIGIVAVQIIAAAKILAGLGFISYNESAVLAGFVFIVFTLVGGQIGILRTDTLQSVILIAGLFVVFLFSLLKHDLQTVETFRFDALFNRTFNPVDLIILILTYSTTFVIGPDIYSRVFCAKDEKVATKAILINAILLIVLAVVLTWLGFFAETDENNGLISFAALKLPGWIHGLFIAALLSAIISSGTTLLNAAMILSDMTTGNLNSKNALKITQLYIVIIGVSSIIIALFITSIIQTLLFALTIYSGAFFVPTLAGLLNIKVNKKRVLMVIIAGGIMALSGKIIKDFFHDFWGSCIIILTYVLNSILLFTPSRKI